MCLCFFAHVVSIYCTIWPNQMSQPVSKPQIVIIFLSEKQCKTYYLYMDTKWGFVFNRLSRSLNQPQPITSGPFLLHSEIYVVLDCSTTELPAPLKVETTSKKCHFSFLKWRLGYSYTGASEQLTRCKQQHAARGCSDDEGLLDRLWGRQQRLDNQPPP